MGLGLFIANIASENPSDFLLFLGRFHPLAVHLPIGFLLLDVIVQLATRWPKFHPIKPFTPYLWMLGAISAAIAILFGYFISLSGDYDADTLFWHKWSGVGVLSFSIACYFFFKKPFKAPAFAQWASVFVVFASLTYTGHLGGNLTHGQTYLLEYAPNPVRGFAGLPPKAIPRKKVMVLDSADVFLDLVQPIMDSKCVSCHNAGKKKGDLLLTSYNAIMKGGENGEIIISADVEGSELYRRITLPENHDDFMPSEGKRPLTDQEVDIVAFWIAVGAPPNGFITELDTEKKIAPTVNNYLGLDKNSILNKIVPAADKAVVDSLKNRGFILNRLMRDNYFLDANFSLSERSLEDSDVELLLRLKEQLVWLNLANSKVSDTHLGKIGHLENLVKLDLRGNSITDAGLGHLSNLKNLESLNLYGTKVSDGVFEVLPQLAQLKKIYLWQTQVSDSMAIRLQKANKNLSVIYERENF